MDQECERDREVRHAGGEVAGAVQGVQAPQAFLGADAHEFFVLVAGHLFAEEIVFRPVPRQLLLQPLLQGDIGLGHDAAVELRMALHIGKARQHLFLRELAHQIAQGFEVGKHQSGARLQISSTIIKSVASGKFEVASKNRWDLATCYSSLATRSSI